MVDSLRNWKMEKGLINKIYEKYEKLFENTVIFD